MVSVCVHCFRESSRIRHPPAPSKAGRGGAWWRTEAEEETGQSAVQEQEGELDDSLCLIPGLLDEDEGGVGIAGSSGLSPTTSRPKLTRRSTFMGEDVNENGEVNEKLYLSSPTFSR